MARHVNPSSIRAWPSQAILTLALALTALAGTAAAQEAQRAALRAIFGDGVPPVRSVVGQTGFLPAAGALLDIAAAVRLAGEGRAVGHVLVMGSDITGPHAAMIVSRPPDGC